MTHRTTAGFLTLPLAAYGAILAALVILGLGGWGWFEKSRYDRLKAEYEHFKGGVEALGLAAKKAAADKEAQDKLRKEQADVENKRTTDALLADIKRLRDSRSGRRIVPPAPAASKCPDGQACFDRAQLELALRDYRSAIRGLVDEGSQITIDLDTAKNWARH